MTNWTFFDPHAEQGVPPQMKVVAELISTGAPKLRATQSVKGGLKRDRLRTTLHELVGDEGRHDPVGITFASDQIDFVLADGLVGVSVHAGRAWMNNEALLALLGASCRPDLEWLILVVPQTYMGSDQHSRIVQQITALAAASGVDLDLRGVAIASF